MKAKKTFLFLLLISTSFIFLSFIKNKSNIEKQFNIKDIEKSVAKITDSIYAGKYEVSNKIYRDFIKYLSKNNKSEMLKIAQVDSLNWKDKLFYNEPFVEYYFTHPAYDNYPVVNISYDAANLFCKWLTDEYNANAKRKYKKVIFRLPTQNEWEKAASAGFNYNFPWGNKLILNDKLMCNYRYVGEENIFRDSATNKLFVYFSKKTQIYWEFENASQITAPIDSYYPNIHGLYNVCGNVAEMVNEKGICRGGGWKNVGGEVKIASKSYYTKSQPDLGFRYFMEIVEF